MKNLYALPFLLLATIPVAFPQHPEVFEKMVKASDLIVEGQVLSIRAYWSEDKAEINTENIIKINKIYKGQLLGENLIVITRGGIIDDNTFQLLTHHIQLYKDLYGLFFIDQIIDKESIYKLHYADWGFLEIFGKNPQTYFSHPLTGEVPYDQVISQLLLMIAGE